MGAKTCMLVTGRGSARDILAATPPIDRSATVEVVQQLFPGSTLTPLEDGDLFDTYPPDGHVFAGVFGEVTIVAAADFGIDRPSELPDRFIPSVGTTTLHAMHSAVDWFAFGHWVEGRLVRSLSVSPDHGVIEETGDRLEFERPFWSGAHPAVEDDEEYPLAFHPLELGEAALLAFFGYQIEGAQGDGVIDPESFPLLQFRREHPRSAHRPSRRWWQFWK